MHSKRRKADECRSGEVNDTVMQQVWVVKVPYNYRETRTM